MESEELICLDSSILIDFFRKVDKSKSFFYKLTKKHKLFSVSVITEYEILVGSNGNTSLFWNDFFEKIIVLPFDKQSNVEAVKIYKQLKADNKLIEIPDILIAATAKANNLKLATFNKKHFERIKGLELILNEKI